MEKVWFGRVWVMTGRWQLMFLERPVGRPRRLERAWIRQIYAPYLHGSGVALTAGPWSLRFGLCRPGLEITEQHGDFDWEDIPVGEHLDASLFEGIGPEPDDTLAPIEVEPVTALVDARTNTLVAVVHEGGEVEYAREQVHHTP